MDVSGDAGAVTLPSDGGYLVLAVIPQLGEGQLQEVPESLWAQDEQNLRVTWVRDTGTTYAVIEAGLNEGRPFERIVQSGSNRYIPTAIYLPNGDVLVEHVETFDDPSLGAFLWMQGDGGAAVVAACANTPDFGMSTLPDGTMLVAAPVPPNAALHRVPVRAVRVAARRHR